MTHRRHARFVVPVALLTAGTLVLAGCGTKLQGKSSTGGSAGKSLVYWSSWPAGTSNAKLDTQIAADFEKATGVKVTVKTLGTDVTTPLENAAATGGDVPDVFYTNAGALPSLRATKVLGPLTAALAETVPGTGKKLSAQIPATYLKASSDKVGLGLVPSILDGNGIWYDAARYPELATKTPATFDDLLAAAASYKAAGKVPFAEEGAQSRYNLWWFFMLMMRNGGAGSFAKLSQSSAAWDAPAARAAAQDVERLVKGGYFQPGFGGSVYPNAQNRWRQGKMVMELNGSWLASETAPVAPSGSRPQVFSFPSVAGAAHNGLQYEATLGYAIEAKSRKQALDARFVAFAMQPKYQRQVASMTDNIPTLNGVSAPESLTGIQKAAIAATESTSTWDGAPSVAPKWWTDVISQVDDKLIKGQDTVDQFLAEGKRLTAAYLASGTK